jgi:hypothetical protein
MAKKFLTGLNLVVLDTDPATGSEGELYFNSSASVAKIYQAGSWSVLGAGGGGTTVSTTEPESPEIGDSWYKNDTGEFYVYDGTYWVEVNGVVENPGSVPTGGTVGQILAKVDDTNYNTEWIDNAAESTLYLVRNNTGATIPKGTLVAAAGAEPSGRIDVSPYQTTGQQDSELRVMGVAIQNIANGVNGTVMSFGTLTGIDTRGTSVSPIAVGDETWAEGDILYAHPTVPGKLTKVRPQHDLAIAFITVRHASTGQIAVRIIPGNNHLEWLHDVEMTLPSEDEILRYNSSASVWVNTHPNIITAKNVTESTIPAFTPVYINTQEFDQDNITFAPADSASSAYLAKLPADAITTASVASNGFGKLVTMGVVTGVDLTGYSLGDTLYVAPGGGLTSTRPAGSSVIQPFARVLSTDNGTIYVYGNTFVSSTDNLPNLETNKVWYGNSGRPVQTTLDTSIVAENTNLYFTDERAQDAAAELFTSGVHNGASVEYNDSTGKINITNTGVTGIYGTANKIEVSSVSGEVTVSIPDSPVFVTPDIGVAAATSINGTSIPTSASLVVSTDLEDYLTIDSASSTYSTLSHNHSLDSLSNVEISDLADGDAIVWNSASSKWINKIADSGSATTVSESDPIDPESGDSWYKPSDESFYIYDGNSWVEVSTMSDEETQDKVAPLFNHSNHTNIEASYDDENNEILLSLSENVFIDNDLEVNGYLTLLNSPSANYHAATKLYVDEIAKGIVTKPSVYAATTASLDATYSNGTSGVGATLTSNSNGSFPLIDGVQLSTTNGLRGLLVKNQSSSLENGRYNLTTLGDESTPWVLTRCGLCDESYEIPGMYAFVSSGSVNGGKGFVAIVENPVTFTIGIDSIVYTQFSDTGQIQAGANLEKDGETLSVIDSPVFSGTLSASSAILSTPLSYEYGGTGLSTIGTSGQVIKVNSTEDGLEWGTGGGGGSSAAAVTSDPPSSPELNQVWQDLDTGRIYVWNGDFWIEVQQNGSLGLLRYLGASSTAPTTSIDGSDLQVGEVYFDTVFNGMKVYDGTGWEDAFSAASLSVSRWVKTTVGGETSLSGNDDNSISLSYTPGIEEVYLNGVKLIRTSDYIASSGSMISNLEPLTANSIVEVISYSGFTLANTYTKTEVDNLIQKQGVRWTLVAGAGTSITTLSGSDDYSNILSYTPGTDQVFINGILIVRGVDYTATDGTSVVLNTALTPGDVVEIIGNSAFSIANTYTKAEIDAKDASIMVFALSDEFSNLTTGLARVTFRAPFAMTLTQIPRASLSTSSSSGLPTVDINVNGTSILGANKLSIDINEKTSVTAATETTLVTTGISDDSEITFDIDVAGTGAKGLKVVLYYKRA